jgi:hypothetical protein
MLLLRVSSFFEGGARESVPEIFILNNWTICRFYGIRLAWAKIRLAVSEPTKRQCHGSKLTPPGLLRGER